ncbi:MAG: hypothetical protein ACI4TK_03060 [Agathobacter sp.]
MQYKGSLKGRKVILFIIMMIYTIYVIVSLFHVRVPGGYSSVFQAKKYFYEASNVLAKDMFCFSKSRIQKDLFKNNEKIWARVEGVKEVDIHISHKGMMDYVAGEIVFDDDTIKINVSSLPASQLDQSYIFISEKLEEFCVCYWDYLLKKTCIVIIIWCGLFVGTICGFCRKRKEILGYDESTE